MKKSFSLDNFANKLWVSHEANLRCIRRKVIQKFYNKIEIHHIYKVKIKINNSDTNVILIDSEMSATCYLVFKELRNEEEHWPHTPVSVGSIPAAETIFFY